MDNKLAQGMRKVQLIGYELQLTRRISSVLTIDPPPMRSLFRYPRRTKPKPTTTTDEQMALAKKQVSDAR